MVPEPHLQCFVKKKLKKNNNNFMDCFQKCNVIIILCKGFLLEKD